MPYVERITRAGKTIEIERYFTSRYKKQGIKRGDKVKPTTEQQEKINTRQAERKLRILINANYGYGDYHLVLDYIRKKGEPDRTREQMRKDIDILLSCKLDAPVPCRLDAPDFGFVCHVLADCLHQHQQVI